MTRGSILEYRKAIRERYLKVGRREKGKILDEFTQVTGYHRKAAIRLLRREPSLPRRGRRGGRRRYEAEVVEALRKVWESSDRVCSKRLQPFLGELVHVMRVHGELQIDGKVADLLCKMSPATIDRLLRPWRRTGGRRPLSTTRPGSLVKSSIPIRTFADWTEGRPGFLEADLVAHCGESVEGFYLNTLSTVDVATGWFECVPVWGKGEQRVRGAIHRIRQRLPFPLLGLDSDNGGEFINHHLLSYCRDERITFTRSRPYKKNDSCHVEQKNWSVVRRLVGYDRYTSHDALRCLELLYLCLHEYVNFFQPTMKLLSKTRHGAKVHKVYDTAKTPYQRLLGYGILSPGEEARLTAFYQRLNPVRLLSYINGHLEKLWKLAARPTPQLSKKPRTKKEAVSVTRPVEATIPVR
jgi:hypothetical protein